MGIYLTWMTLSLALLVQSGVFCKTIHSKTIHHLMTKRELQKYFGVDSHDKVPEYDVTHPYQSTHEGEFVTYDLRSKHRARRGADVDDTHHYSLNAFGKRLDLVLRENKNLIKPGLQVESHAGGKVKKTRLEPSTHYLGEVRDHPESSVAITNHGALSGMIKLRDDALFLHPLPLRIAKKVRRNKRSTAHIIYRHGTLGGTLEDSALLSRDDVFEDLKGLTKVAHQTERVSDENDVAVSSNVSERYLEIAMVADEHVKALHGNDNGHTAEYLLTLANIMNGIFHYDTFGEQKLAVVVTKLYIVTSEELGTLPNGTAHQKIHALSSWSNRQYPTGENATPPPFEAISLVHRGSDLLGLALLSGLCVVRMTPSLAADIGLQGAYKLSHEIAHNMGIGHDGGGSCPTGIMSTSVIGGPEMFKWSNCSKAKAQQYLSGPMSFCLKDEPPNVRPTSLTVSLDKLPGEVNDGDVQCQYQYGSSWRRCPQKFSDCKTLFCTRDYVYCHSYNAAPLDGTTCGSRNWCIKGECVDNGSPYINGAWSAWSDIYSECTRSCGGGVQHRTRTCSNPPPQNGGDPCVGDKKGHWRICNPEPCPANTPSFRATQCKAKNSQTVPYHHSSSCQLRCVKDSLLYSYGKVADGTRCNPDTRVFDVCIKGTCRSVGCDHVLSSSARPDRCGICNGDGSSCAYTTDVYTRNHKGWGPDNADTISTLPPGTVKAHFQKRDVTYNLLGIQNAEGSYLIPIPSWSTSIKAAGSKIVYRHESNLYQDTIDIDGPTTETLVIKYVYLYGDNGGIDYSYYSPSNESQPTTYHWNTTAWSSCSHTCAGGYQTRWVFCLRDDDNTYARASLCDSASKPHMAQPCNTEACPPQWHLTKWQECSKSCGKGSQSRRLYCRKKINSTNYEELPDSSCPIAKKPNVTEFTRHCRKIACPPDWEALDWSTCSTTCGPGVTTRNLVCQRVDANGQIITVTSTMCDPMPKPITSQTCNADTPCGPPDRIKIACFRANPVPLEQNLGDLSSSVDWDHTEITVERCQNLTHEAGFKYFALANNGICYSGPNTKTLYYGQKPASLADCNNGIGKQGFMFVYTMEPLPPLTSLGCYSDSNLHNPVLPTLYANFRNQINWYNMNLTINQCAHVARDLGRSYFGIRFYGECYSAPDNEAASAYSQQGEASTCWSGVGSNYASFFYTFNNA